MTWFRLRTSEVGFKAAVLLIGKAKGRGPHITWVVQGLRFESQ